MILDWLLTLSGFAPDLSGCSACGSQEAAAFFPIDGVLYCSSCIGRMPQDRLRLTLPEPVQRAMRYICEAPAKKLFSFRLTPDSEKSLGTVAEAYAICQTGAQFKSLGFLKSIS